MPRCHQLTCPPDSRCHWASFLPDGPVAEFHGLNLSSRKGPPIKDRHGWTSRRFGHPRESDELGEQKDNLRYDLMIFVEWIDSNSQMKVRAASKTIPGWCLFDNDVDSKISKQNIRCITQNCSEIHQTQEPTSPMPKKWVPKMSHEITYVILYLVGGLNPSEKY